MKAEDMKALADGLKKLGYDVRALDESSGYLALTLKPRAKSPKR